jgi:hypothetical protein
MTMSERERKAWSWAGKIALVALPAAISGFASYKKSQVESEAQGAAAYTALRTAFEAQQKDFEGQQRELEETKHLLFALEGEVRVLREALKLIVAEERVGGRPPLPTAVPVRPPLLPESAVGAADAGTPDAGVEGDGDGLHDALRMNLKRVKSRADAVSLPAKYEDMVQQYAPKK